MDVSLHVYCMIRSICLFLSPSVSLSLPSSKDYGKTFENITTMFPSDAVAEWYYISSNADIVSFSIYIVFIDLHLSLSLSLSLSLFLSHFPLYLSIYLSIYLFIYLSIHPLTVNFH